ncbi:unnamed protein product [Adineta steineri]|uniref:Uncharacterized protein n=1 Tax=Adineta steineri TaxID=433720 RepID=A0A814GVL6_9BILA|nr:unnamed protein product [Adineta steineri]CAF3990397.1 unnamed protein product [Adineta steineri]
MAWLDMVPGVAHVKALAQVVTGDEEGAERTMHRFTTKTPIVSHLTAGIAKVCGEDDLAKECWNGANSSLNALPVVGHAKGLGHYVFGDVQGGNCAMKSATSTSMDMIDGIPVAGHAKGVIHYAVGDKAGGDRAMISATRTATVMGAGAGGFLVAGPAGAVAAGMGVGAEWDLVTAAVTDGKQLNGICKVIDNPTKIDSYFEAGLKLGGDALTGYAGGKVAERVIKSSEISTADRLRTVRKEKGLPENKNVFSGKKGKEIFSEVKDRSTGKTHFGVNASVRKTYNDLPPKPNHFIEQHSDIKPPLDRDPAVCAEAQAYHKYVIDKSGSNPSTINTRINTVEVRSNGDIYNMPRCDNCMAYKHVVGKCNTDGMVGSYS